MSAQGVAPWLVGSRWPTVPIRLVARLGSGHTPSRSKPEYWENCSIPWVTLSDVWQFRTGEQQYVSETNEMISQLGLANSAATLHAPGTVILSRTASVGFSAIMGSEMATSQDFATWTCGPRLDPRFLLYVLRGMAPDLRRISMGSTHKTIYMPDIEQLRTPVPPVEEQRRIADFLDVETSRIDRLVSARSRQISVLQEYAQASVSEALLPGILTSAQHSWPWRWLPVLPRDRPLVRLGYICRIQNGLIIDSKRDTTGDSVTLPYLRVANVQAGYVSLDNVTEVTVPREVAVRSTLRAGDVLMTEGGDLDKLGRGTVWRGELPECLHQNHVFALRPDSGRLDAEYLALMTQTVHGRCYFESTGVKTTNLASTNSGKILSFPIPLPDVDVQRKLVAEVKGTQARLNRVQAALEKQLSLLAERRQALITAAITGKFDVSAASGRNTTQGV